MNNQDLMADAERELHDRIVEILQVADEGKVLGGALVDSIHSYGMCEDNATLYVMCDMADCSTVMISVCPGGQITVCVVAEAQR